MSSAQNSSSFISKSQIKGTSKSRRGTLIPSKKINNPKNRMMESGKLSQMSRGKSRSLLISESLQSSENKIRRAGITGVKCPRESMRANKKSKSNSRDVNILKNNKENINCSDRLSKFLQGSSNISSLKNRIAACNGRHNRFGSFIASNGVPNSSKKKPTVVMEGPSHNFNFVKFGYRKPSSGSNQISNKHSSNGESKSKVYQSSGFRNL